MGASTRAKAETCGRSVSAATVFTVALKISFDHCAGRRSGKARARSPDSTRSASISCARSYVAVSENGPSHVSVSSSYSTWSSAWRTPLMNVTAEMSGRSPCARTISSAPSPFWIVITVADGTWPASRAAAASTSVAFVARMTRSASGRADSSAVARRAAVKSLLPETRRPLDVSASAWSGRRVSTQVSATRAR